MRNAFGIYGRLLESAAAFNGGPPLAPHSLSTQALPPATTFDDFVGTPGDDNFTGTSGDDEFDFFDGGNDTARGRNGKDQFNFYDNLTRDDSVDGGNDHDALTLSGDYSTQLVFRPSTLTRVEEIDLWAGHSYSLKLKDANVEPIGANNANISGAAFAVVCAFSSTLILDASHETDAAILVQGGDGGDTISTGGGIDVIRPGTGTNVIDGGANTDRAAHEDLDDPVTIDLSIAGNQDIAPFTHNTYINIEDVSGTPEGDTLTGKSGANWLWGLAGIDQLTGKGGDDRLEGGLGADTMEGGKDDDHYLYGISGTTSARQDSTGAGFDTITGFDFAEDHFEMDLAVLGIDPNVGSGTLSDASFDADLAAAVDATKLGAHNAVLYLPDAGGHAGEVFLIVDANASAGYQAGLDVVIRLESLEHRGSMDLTDFIEG